MNCYLHHGQSVFANAEQARLVLPRGQRVTDDQAELVTADFE